MNFTAECTDFETQLQCEEEFCGVWHPKDEVWQCPISNINRCEDCQFAHEPNCPGCSSAHLYSGPMVNYISYKNEEIG
jgi:hypothetical protein